MILLYVLLSVVVIALTVLFVSLANYSFYKRKRDTAIADISFSALFTLVSVFHSYRYASRSIGYWVRRKSDEIAHQVK